MRYRGPQPCEGDTPYELYQTTTAPLRDIVELYMVANLAKNDDVWVRLGMLQRILESGLSVTGKTIKYALTDCLRLANEAYPTEWAAKRRNALWESLKAVTAALEGMDAADGEDCDLLTTLGRSTLVTEADARRLTLLWNGK